MNTPVRLSTRPIRTLLLVVVAALLLTACTAIPLSETRSPNHPPGAPPQSSDRLQVSPVQVTNVVDGDTIDVRFEDSTKERVRFIGVDTPETVKPGTPVQPFGPEASSFTKKSLSDRDVFLEFDVQERDRYGRLLAYIWLERPPKDPSAEYIGNNMFNAVLLLEGFAQVATFPPNVKYVDYFTGFQKTARDARAGMWVSSDSGSGGGGVTVKVVSVTSPVKAGSDASLVIETEPRLECAIVVNYKSGPSGAAGLEPQTANNSGRINWTWKVAGGTTPGTWDIDVTCADTTITSSFTVTE